MRVQVVNEVSGGEAGDEWRLCFQWCNYINDNGTISPGYRFIWRKDGQLKPFRGQTRLLSIKQAEELMDKAKAEGWGDNHGS